MSSAGDEGSVERLGQAIDDLGATALGLKRQVEDYENRIVVAHAVIDKCVRALLTRNVDIAGVINELVVLRGGVLKVLD